jgi:catechol 2,3-dioxygenase-like lactoylglutathione lyase family enzyme
VSFRIELFVADLDVSIRFYDAALGFGIERREPDYASLRRGAAVLGLAPVAKLPPAGEGPGFTQESVSAGRGAGVEVVLEVEDLDAARQQVEAAGYPIAEEVQLRPWGLRDFRLTDPDGYYLRVTTSGRSAGSGPA